MHCFQSGPYHNGDMTMTHVAAPPAVVLAAATAVAPRRRRSRAQMKALDLLYVHQQHAIGVGGPLRPSVWPLCQPLLEFIKLEQ